MTPPAPSAVASSGAPQAVGVVHLGPERNGDCWYSWHAHRRHRREVTATRGPQSRGLGSTLNGCRAICCDLLKGRNDLGIKLRPSPTAQLFDCPLRKHRNAVWTL
jgi:hypothetical protein